MDNNFKNTFIAVLVVSIISSSIFGGVMGYWAAGLDSGNAGFFNRLNERNLPAQSQTERQINNIVELEHESAVISAVERVAPAVVSIIVTKDLPVVERYNSSPFGGSFFRDFFGDDFSEFFETPQYRQRGTERRQVGGGSGFIVSADGYIMTNRHVVSDENAEYTVLLNDESKHDAKVLARDIANDLAVLKIEKNGLPFAPLGGSDNLKVGQTAIAIGNSLGEFSNTVSKGVISGLSRSVVAGGFGQSEQLRGVIQTDASINPGNSGGPLLDISGEVIGINTAMAMGAENIGFAIPVNEVKKVFESVKEHGRIVRPWLGVRYVLINDLLVEANDLKRDHGALVVKGETESESAIISGSPADKAGIKENDIILEINGQKIDEGNTLADAIAKHKPGDEIVMKVFRGDAEEEIRVKLEEMR
jgi:serine protease Do